MHDPQVTVDRRRTLTPAGLVEEIEVASRGQEAVELTLHVDLVADLAPMADVRQGPAPTDRRSPAERTDGRAGLAPRRHAASQVDVRPGARDVGEGRPA